VGALCFELREEVDWLRSKWLEFRELFAKGPARIELLNTVASNFFCFLNKLLFEDGMLHLCRLTDPPGKARQENLTVCRLAYLITEPKSKFPKQVRQGVDEAVAKCEFARRWRNKRLAHSDLASLRGKSVSPFPEVTAKNIEEAVNSIDKLLASVERHYDIQKPLLAPDPFGARSLLSYLGVARAERRV